MTKKDRSGRGLTGKEKAASCSCIRVMLCTACHERRGQDRSLNCAFVLMNSNAWIIPQQLLVGCPSLFLTTPGRKTSLNRETWRERGSVRTLILPIRLPHFILLSSRISTTNNIFITTLNDRIYVSLPISFFTTHSMMRFHIPISLGRAGKGTGYRHILPSMLRKGILNIAVFIFIYRDRFGDQD